MKEPLHGLKALCGRILLYFFGFIILIIGFVGLFGSVLFGLSFLALGLFLLPPITQKIEEYIKKPISIRKRLITTAVILFFSPVFIAINQNDTRIPTNQPVSIIKTAQHRPATNKEPTTSPPPQIDSLEVIQEVEPTINTKKTTEPNPTPHITTQQQEVSEPNQKGSEIKNPSSIPNNATSVSPKEVPQEIVTDPTFVPVTKVVDGDTIDVLYQGQTERIRIQGLDTPETKDPRYPVQCFGQKATDQAKAILENKKIYLETDGSRGKYNRIISYIRLTDGTDYGEKMIRDGYAWHYSKYPHNRMDKYRSAEQFARNNENGLWSKTTCNGEKKPVEEAVKETKTAVSDIITNTPIPKTQTKEAIPEETTEEVIETFECSRDTYNCGDFRLQKEAQNMFDYCYNINGDIHKLDRDNNLIVCESLP